MEYAPSNESMERLISPEEKERLERALAHLGLVDVTLCDTRLTKEYNDRKWAVEFDPNPDIILSNN